MKYDIECANSLAELIEVIFERLNDGWVPQGGICVLLAQNGYTVFYQAVTKSYK